MAGGILIVDDDARIRASLERALAPLAAQVRSVGSAEEALNAVSAAEPAVVLTDLRMPGLSGIELLRLLKERAPTVDVVLMTAYDDLPVVAEAMREGAVDFLVKPLDIHGLRRVLERLFEDRRLRAGAAHPVGSGAGGGTGPGEARDEPAPRALVGRDARMIEIFKVVGQVAATRANVVIRGESGTGKELIARALHDSSPWSAEPFVAVNCTALPQTLLESELFGHVRGAFTGATSDRRGRFALAGRGTIFLDEIGDTTPELQGKLLRVLQEHEYFPVGADRGEHSEARVIAATHRNLEALVARGEFREDLYYRLRVVEVVVPPLRERTTDIPLLAEHLVRKAARTAGCAVPVLSSQALDALLSHSWPGNVRELENCLTRAVVVATGDVIRGEHLALGPPPAARPAAALTSLEQVERDHVASVLAATGGSKKRAAQVLGVSRPRLDRLLRKYRLHSAGRQEP